MNLIPRVESQKLTASMWETHTPSENKLELIEEEALWGGAERDRLLMALLYNVGLKHLVEILPSESKQSLCQLCQVEA